MNDQLIGTVSRYDVATQVVVVVGCVLSGVIAFLAFAMVFSTKYRDLMTWAFARWIDPDRWNDEDWWDDFRRDLVARLNVKERPATTADTIRPKRSDVPHARSRCYSAVTEDELIVKRASNRDGNRVLGKEFKVIKQLRAAAGESTYKAYLPVPISRSLRDGHLIAIYKAGGADCYTARQIRQRYPEGVSGRHVAWMFNRTLEVIGFAHRQGTVHAAVMPQHLLFDCTTHGLRLTDWTHAKRVGSPITYLPRPYRAWYPETRNVWADESLDIYMAAKSARYLAGIGPDESSELPKPIDRFLRSCLIESARMRPRDAWQLREEFQDVLDSVYGEPKFCSLTMN